MARTGRGMPDESDPQQSAGGGTDIEASKNILKALGITALSMLPAGAVIRGGTLIYRGLRGANAIQAARKALENKQQPAPARIGQKKPTTAVDKPKAGGEVKAPGTGVSRTDRVIQADGGKTMRTVRGTESEAKRIAGAGQRGPRMGLGSKVKTGTAALSAAAMSDKKKDIAGIQPARPEEKKPEERKPEERKPAKKMATPTSPPPRARKSPIDLGTVKNQEVKEAQEPRKATGSGGRGSAKKGATKIIDAGGNTGFGIKGNKFVGGPEERAVMVKYYGGTGSAAAKAAQEGKQGKLKELGMDSLNKELQEARKKRFEREQKNMRKGGAVKKAIGSMDYRQGGTLISVQDRMKRMK
jgi:hypothetical protein